MTLHIYACSQQQQLEKLQMDHGWMVITDWSDLVIWYAYIYGGVIISYPSQINLYAWALLVLFSVFLRCTWPYKLPLTRLWVCKCNHCLFGSHDLQRLTTHSRCLVAQTRAPACAPALTRVCHRRPREPGHENPFFGEGSGSHGTTCPQQETLWEKSPPGPSASVPCSILACLIFFCLLVFGLLITLSSSGQLYRNILFVIVLCNVQ